MNIAPGPRLLVISATRNEADNVRPLTDRLVAALADFDITWELLFVDDSDDDTPDRIRELTLAGHPVRMLHRLAGERRGGLSSALNVGFTTSAAELLVVIDGDLQHPPEVVPALLTPLLQGEADITIASRYVPGGSATGLAGPFRHSVSRAATGLVQVMFPRLRRIKDPVSGFFARRSAVLDDVELRPEGFKMLVELLVRGRWDHQVEVPFHFAGRTEGVSNVSPRLGLYFLRHVGRLWAETTGPRALRRFTKPNPAHPLLPMLTEKGEFVLPARS